MALILMLVRVKTVAPEAKCVKYEKRVFEMRYLVQK